MNAEFSLRSLKPKERKELKRLAYSRTAPTRLNERARMLLAVSKGGQTFSAIARYFHTTRTTLYNWVHRFNEGGTKALDDRPRSGRPVIYAFDKRAELLGIALTHPEKLGLPFCCWTLDRIQAYLSEKKGIRMKRSRINEILLEEGLEWRKQETWFGERVDPDFAKKRGLSTRSIRRRLREAA
jgi:transposase